MIEASYDEIIMIWTNASRVSYLHKSIDSIW